MLYASYYLNYLYKRLVLMQLKKFRENVLKTFFFYYLT